VRKIELKSQRRTVCRLSNILEGITQQFAKPDTLSVERQAAHLDLRNAEQISDQLSKPLHLVMNRVDRLDPETFFLTVRTQQGFAVHAQHVQRRFQLVGHVSHKIVTSLLSHGLGGPVATDDEGTHRGFSVPLDRKRAGFDTHSRAGPGRGNKSQLIVSTKPCAATLKLCEKGRQAVIRTPDEKPLSNEIGLRRAQQPRDKPVGQKNGTGVIHQQNAFPEFLDDRQQSVFLVKKHLVLRLRFKAILIHSSGEVGIPQEYGVHRFQKFSSDALPRRNRTGVPFLLKTFPKRYGRPRHGNSYTPKEDETE